MDKRSENVLKIREAVAFIRHMEANSTNPNWVLQCREWADAIDALLKDAAHDPR